MANTPKEAGPTAQRVAANVRALRRARGLDLADVSDRLAEVGQPIGLTGVSKIELGTRRVDVDDLVALAVAFGVSPSRLLLPETGSDELIALTPLHTAAERAAWAWATGDHPLPTPAGRSPGQGPNAGDARTGSFRLSGGGDIAFTGVASAADFQTANRPHAPRDTWTLDQINAHVHSLDQLAHAVRGALADGVPTATIHRWIDHVVLTRPVEGTTDKGNADHGAR